MSLGYRHVSWQIALSTVCIGRGPRVVVSTAAFHARIRGSVPGLGGLKETKNVSSPSTCESQYCGKPPWPRDSVLGLRPPGLKFRMLCLEDSVISILRRFSWPSSAYRWPKVRFISFFTVCIIIRAGLHYVSCLFVDLKEEFSLLNSLSDTYCSNQSDIL